MFDKASRMTKGLSKVEFSYGVGNNRYQRKDYEIEIWQKTTIYLGNVEHITAADGSDYYKRYLGGIAISNYYSNSGTEHVDYLLKDHIGSIHTVLDANGLIKNMMHFGAFGERQEVMNWRYSLIGYLFSPENEITTRGFTGHEMVDSMGIIHMNGRIYDAVLGRFLQADPQVQAPKNSQSLNRYTYVFNNPLSNTDPTGYFSLSGFVKQYWRTAISIAITVILPGHLGSLNAITKGAVTGFVAGGVASGSFKGALVGAFTGSAFGALHGWTPTTNQGMMNKVFAHGVVGGAGSALSGGKFGHGFAAAGFTQAVGQFGGDNFFADSASTSDRMNNVIKAAMIGGTASVISGGKFANGAITGAFSRALNEDAVTKFAKKAAKLNSLTNLVRQAQHLNEADFRLLFPGYNIFSDLTLDQLHLFEDFSIEVLSGNLNELGQQGTDVIEEYAIRRVLKVTGVRGSAISASVKALNLTATQERLVIDLFRVQGGMARFGGDVNSLGGLASQLRSNPVNLEWYKKQ